jgi:hypothetical protein
MECLTLFFKRKKIFLQRCDLQRDAFFLALPVDSLLGELEDFVYLLLEGCLRARCEGRGRGPHSLG